MEMREVYTEEGLGTGQIVEKHAPRIAGQFFLHAIVVLKTQDSPAPGTGEGMYVMQQRSWKDRYYAGKWDVTGGGVLAGETPSQAAVREVREELGLEISQSQLKEYQQFRVRWDDGSGLIISMFGCRVSVPEEGIRFDTYEVNDVKIVPFHVFWENVMDHNDEDFGKVLQRMEKDL